MAALARSRGVLAVVGTQAPFAPEIAYLRQLIADGFVGKVLSTTLVGRGGAALGGGTIPDERTYGYLLDRANGATMLTIPVGHTLAALRSVFGDIAEVSAVLATRRPTAHAADSGGMFASGVLSPFTTVTGRRGTDRACSGRSMTRRVTFGFRVPLAIRRWFGFPCQARMETKKHSGRWKSRRHTVPVGLGTRNPGTSPVCMPQWPGIFAKARAPRPASRMPWLCIGSSRQSRDRQKAGTAPLHDSGQTR